MDSLDGPMPLNASQASHFQSGSQSPFRRDTPANQKAEIDQPHSSQDGVNVETVEDIPPIDVKPNHDINEDVQVPATNPANRSQPIRNPALANSSQPGPQSTPNKKPEENGADRDLEEFDWDGFHDRYYRELSDIIEDDNAVIAEFDRFSEAFAIWARSSTAGDTTRAGKRLKTRERYIELAEESLEEKKEHYVHVVEAFKNALKLLGH